MRDPKAAPVVPGTGGLRKTRFAATGRGKRGSLRIGYVYFEEFGVIALLAVYAKSDQADIPANQRQQIRGMIGELRRWLATGG
jgi:hypothetical protein